MKDPDNIEDTAELIPLGTGAGCDVPSGKAFVPAPTKANQMLVSKSDGAGGFTWSTLDPPAAAADQPQKFGTSGPYWQNV